MSDPSQHVERIAGLFDAVSDSYDTVGVDFFQPIAAELVDELNPQAGEHWLDIGCGRGAVLLRAAAAVGPDGRAVGVDISSGMVKQARRLAAAGGHANVEVEQGDASDPRRFGDAFDVVSSSLVLFFLPDPGMALRAWLPTLRPGGRLGIATFGDVDPRWANVDEVFDPYLPAAMKDARTSGRHGPFATDGGMEQLVVDAGFVEVRTLTHSVLVRFTDADQWHAFTWAVGQRQMWLSVPEEDRLTVRAAAERRLAEHAAADGSITFVQPVRQTFARRST